GHDLAQVAPGAEDAGVGRRADRAAEVGALDPALEAEDERQSPDDESRAEDQDAGLPQRLAEEAEHAPAEDLLEVARGGLRHNTERGDPVARNPQPAQRHAGDCPSLPPIRHRAATLKSTLKSNS